MLAFASNSLLCRTALKQTQIDAATFTSLRILAGAVALAFISMMRRQTSLGSDGSWTSAFLLFVYAAGFSFAYVNLSAGTGALLLFVAVQATMIFWGWTKGERFRAIQFAGFIIAAAGLVLLLFPGLTAPPLGGSLCMIGAGVAWGVYSLRGRIAADPIAATCGNFLRALPLAALLTGITIRHANINSLGAVCAIISGAVTSGVGYIFWYSALPSLKSTNAATVQLCVPILAATGGILLLGEPITLRYAVATITVLGGIALVLFERSSRHRK